MSDSNKSYYFPSPKGASLICTTVIFTIVLCALSASGFNSTIEQDQILFASLPLCIIALALLHNVTGYTIKGQNLLIHRLLWRTKIDVSSLKKIRIDSSAMSATYRLFGNPGIFALSGYFWNDRLGKYRAYVTNFEAFVVIRLNNGKAIVVSPKDPDRFLETLRVSTRPEH